MTEPNENQSSLCFDLRVRIAALAQNHVRCDDCTFAKTPQQRYLHFADAVIREIGLRPERWKTDDPRSLRGDWTRWVTEWRHPNA